MSEPVGPQDEDPFAADDPIACAVAQLREVLREESAVAARKLAAVTATV